MATFYFPKYNQTFVVPRSKLVNMTLAFRKELQPFLITNKKPALPFIQELLSLNDLKVRKQKALEIQKKKYPNKSMLGEEVYTCFGILNYKNISLIPELKERKIPEWMVIDKTGIEILNNKVDQRGRNYTSKLSYFLSVNRLRERCKENGIKPIPTTRTGLFKALMSI